MTPAARLGAAIEILDLYLAGTAAEQALTNWARRSRFAGSKDREAVRDIVFQSIRCKLSYAASGGEMSGRGIGIGYAKTLGLAGRDLFGAGGYGPEALNENETSAFESTDLPSVPHTRLDYPDWLEDQLTASLGDTFPSVMEILQQRAPVFLRVNLTKASRDSVIAKLAAEDIQAVAHPLADAALEVVTNPRRIRNSAVLSAGLIDFQDAASQAVCEALPNGKSMRILDYCAGGGGKALALADKAHAAIYAHDASPARMRDLPERATRAGATIELLKTQDLRKQAPFDLVLCDVPCSGSGAWRRAPEGKWSLTAEKLDALHDAQTSILSDASQLVSEGGTLAYATCSLLRSENEEQIETFCAKNKGWRAIMTKRFSPLDGGDGFFVVTLSYSK